MSPRARRVLVVDGANVVGATPDGWWRDRGKAAAGLHHRLLMADLPHDRIVLVLEGQAKAGVPAGRDAHVQVVHAPRDGDSAIVKAVRTACAAAEKAGGTPDVTAITADRGLAVRVEAAGGRVMSPTWLLSHL